MTKWIQAFVAAAIIVITAGCSTSNIPTAPSMSSSVVEGPSGGVSGVRQAGIQCSDAPVQWITTSFSPVGRSARVYWVAVPNIDTYELEVYHSRDDQRFQKSFVGFYKAQGLAEATLGDPEDGGRYYVRVRVLNKCGLAGEWSSVLIIYMDGQPNAGDGPDYNPPGGGDDDNDNGHGNDDDGDDDSNPGGGGGPIDEPCTDEDDNNNGHGNDCDKDDDSNPSGH